MERRNGEKPPQLIESATECSGENERSIFFVNWVEIKIDRKSLSAWNWIFSREFPSSFSIALHVKFAEVSYTNIANRRRNHQVNKSIFQISPVNGRPRSASPTWTPSWGVYFPAFYWYLPDAGNNTGRPGFLSVGRSAVATEVRWLLCNSTLSIWSYIANWN